VYIPDIVANVVSWGRPVSLVSVSQDGGRLPSIFLYEDMIQLAKDHASGKTVQNSPDYHRFQPSRIVKINDQDAVPFLENWSQIDSLQDRDAEWNNLFYSLAQAAQSGEGTGIGTFGGGGRGRWVYPGPETKLTFANGKSAWQEHWMNDTHIMQGLA